MLAVPAVVARARPARRRRGDRGALAVARRRRLPHRGPPPAAARSSVARRSPAAAVHVPRRAGSRRTPTRSSAARARPPALGILGPALAAWVRARERVAVLDVEPERGRVLRDHRRAAVRRARRARRIVRARARRAGASRDACRSRSRCCSRSSPCYQWQAHHLFSNRKLEVDNAYASFYRVNSLFFDPSLFGRFQALAILTIVGVLLLLRRPPRPVLLVLATAGVFVGLALSYSQSSLLALDVGLVVLAAVVWRGRADRRPRRARRARAARVAGGADDPAQDLPHLALGHHVEPQLDPVEGHRRVPAPPRRRLGPRQLRALGGDDRARSARGSLRTTWCCRRRSSSASSG